MNSLIAYIAYFLISMYLTYQVGKNLHKHGKPWIISLIGPGKLSERLNDLLLLGYRLVNMGYILLTLLQGKLVTEETYEIIEFFSVKLGVILLILTWLHYQNIFGLILFSKLKSKCKWQI